MATPASHLARDPPLSQATSQLPTNRRTQPLENARTGRLNRPLPPTSRMQPQAEVTHTASAKSLVDATSVIGSLATLAASRNPETAG